MTWVFLYEQLLDVRFQVPLNPIIMYTYICFLLPACHFRIWPGTMVKYGRGTFLGPRSNCKPSDNNIHSEVVLSRIRHAQCQVCFVLLSVKDSRYQRANVVDSAKIHSYVSRIKCQYFSFQEFTERNPVAGYLAFEVRCATKDIASVPLLRRLQWILTSYPFDAWFCLNPTVGWFIAHFSVVRVMH